MRYSVWNKSRGTYSIYDGPELLPRSLGNNPKGLSPQDAGGILPSGSKFLYESTLGEGLIVESGYTFAGFMLEFLLGVSAAIISKILYEKYFR